MRIPTLTILLLIALPFLTNAPAQDKPSGKYEALVERIQAGDATVDFTELRFACLESRRCNGDGDRDARKAMNQAFQEKRYSAALEQAAKALKSNYADAEAHMLSSQACAETDQPGRAEFHRKIAAGLIRSILSSGDGKAPGTAFKVISIREEYLVLGVNGLRIQSQGLFGAGGHNYDRLIGVKPGTDEKTTLYFNIDSFFGK